MKKLILLFSIPFLLTTARVNAQITLEHTYLTTDTGMGQDFFLTNLGNNDYKYVIYDYGTARFSLYNLNHTPFMLNIQIPIISDISVSAVYRLGYISTTLFDCDSTNIEYAMMLDNISPTKHPNFAVFRTDGTLLFSKDTVATVFCVGCGSGSVEMHPIMNTPDGAKLYLFNNYVNGTVQYFVYSLCGSVPETITEINKSNSFVKVYPNPTSHQINFEITAPSNYEEYELTIFDSMFQTIKITKTNGIKTQVDLDDAALSSGTYFYSLQTKNKVFQTGKFIFSK